MADQRNKRAGAGAGEVDPAAADAAAGPPAPESARAPAPEAAAGPPAAASAPGPDSEAPGPGPAPQPGAEPAAGGEDGAQAQVQTDLDELVATAAQRDEYLALAQRTQADFENYRKRMAREVGAAEARGVTRLAKELLPALDSIQRALEASESQAERAETSEPRLAEGIRLVQADLRAALARLGIEVFSPEGEPFDPTQHEAMAQQPVDGAQPGSVVEVYAPGYRLGDSVIRPARVVVAG